MVKCFKCNSYFNFLSYFVHLKSTHKLRTNDEYFCNEEDCKQSFSSLRTYKKHVSKFHSLDSDNSSLPQNELVQIESKHEFCEENNLQDFTDAFENVIDSVDILESNTNQSIFKLFNISETIKNLEHKFLLFNISLHSKLNINRKDVVEIKKQFSDLVEIIISNIKTAVNCTIKDSEKEEVIKVLDNINVVFKTNLSEFKFLKHLKNKNLFEFPKLFTINNEICETVVDGIPSFEEKIITGCLMPIKFQIKKYFELNNLLNETLKHMDNIVKSNEVTNFINGEIFQKKKNHFDSSQIVIPYFLYLDDFEVNNPLGSHAKQHSLCGIYMSFPSIPQYMLSKLEHILVVGFIKSVDIKKYGNEKCMHLLMEVLKDLEQNGINFENDKLNVKFILGQIIGDNLGLNAILGFSKSFRLTKYCRSCRRSHNEMSCDTVEYNNAIRTKENYENDILSDNFSESGIKERCVFESISSFHVTDNWSFDIMHDLYEGVCKYDLCKIFLYCIDNKFFSLSTLNNRKQYFCYGTCEMGNMSGPLTIERLKNNNISMSASEMQTFVHVLPLIIGDLIPQNCEVCEFFSHLLKILYIVTLSVLTPTDIENLRKFVKLHNEMYMSLFHDNLKPKFHFLTHYGTAIKKIGPLKYAWSFRFESKNREAKTYANVTNSRKNISYSICMKFGLKFSDQIVNPNATDFLKYDTKYENLNEIYKQNLPFYPEINYNMAKISEKITWKGTIYKINQYICKTENYTNIQLYKILKFILCDDKVIYVVVSKLKSEYSEHFSSFEVKNNTNKISVLTIDHFSSYPSNIYPVPNGKSYFRIKNI